MHYVLDENRRAIPASPEQWKKFWASANRIIKQDCIGDHLVSTVFVGTEYAIFETMIFHPRNGIPASEGIEYARTTMWEAAEQAHRDAASLLEGIGGRAVPCETCGKT
jgi:hypothetical protein